MSRWALLGIVCASLGCGTPDGGGTSTKSSVYSTLPPDDPGVRYDTDYPKGDPAPPPNGFASDPPPVPAPPKAAEKIDAPREQWTWVDIVGSHCADGTPTG